MSGKANFNSDNEPGVSRRLREATTIVPATAQVKLSLRPERFHLPPTLLRVSIHSLRLSIFLLSFFSSPILYFLSVFCPSSLFFFLSFLPHSLLSFHFLYFISFLFLSFLLNSLISFHFLSFTSLLLFSFFLSFSILHLLYIFVLCVSSSFFLSFSIHYFLSIFGPLSIFFLSFPIL